MFYLLYFKFNLEQQNTIERSEKTTSIPMRKSEVII